jgi:hypothetical protein
MKWTEEAGEALKELLSSEGRVVVLVRTPHALLFTLILISGSIGLVN